MRKSFLTKEYSLEELNGTFEMKELRNFFSSKILEIEDEMLVGDNNIIWQENANQTQGIGIDTENRILNTFDLKTDNHTIRLQPNQSDQQKREFTRWEFTFNIRQIITQYLFAQLKKNRTFEGIDNNKTFKGSVDRAIRQYIRKNVFPRIEFARVDLYIQYYKLGEAIPGLFDQNNEPIIALQYQPNFRDGIINPIPLSGETTTEYNQRVGTLKTDILTTNFQLNTDARENVATMVFKQKENSLDYKFDYYFDIVWRKA